MKHFVCKGSCASQAEEMEMCESEECSTQWEMMEQCDCVDGEHGEGIVVKDSNGSVLQDGDSVVLIKDLTLRGSSRVFKRGAKVSKIKLTDNVEEIDCKLEGSKIVLRTEFVKKV